MLNCGAVYLPNIPETTVAPESRVSQKEIHLPTINFHSVLVSFMEGKTNEQTLYVSQHHTTSLYDVF